MNKIKKGKYPYCRSLLFFARFSGFIFRTFHDEDASLANASYICRRIAANATVISKGVSILEENTSPLRSEGKKLLHDSEKVSGDQSACKKRKMRAQIDRRHRLIEVDTELNSAAVQFEEYIADAKKTYLCQIRVFCESARREFDEDMFSKMLSPTECEAYNKYLQLNHETNTLIHKIVTNYVQEGADAS